MPYNKIEILIMIDKPGELPLNQWIEALVIVSFDIDEGNQTKTQVRRSHSQSLTT